MKECSKLLDSSDVLAALDLKTSALRSSDKIPGMQACRCYACSDALGRACPPAWSGMLSAECMRAVASWPGLASLIIGNNSVEIHKKKAVDVNAFKLFKRLVAVAQDQSRSGRALT